MRWNRCALAFLVAVGAAAPCHGWEFRSRFVQRIGNQDFPIANDRLEIDASSDDIRLRFQFGVFDDADGPAPAGGFVGWNVGTVSVSGPASNSQDRRTPGRLSPFNFAAQAFSNGNPPPPTLAGPDAPGFDFQTLTEIDATLGTQSPMYSACDPDGNPVPVPPPVIRGLNTFVSVYEITTKPRGLYNGGQGYEISISGNLIAAQEWRTIGTPIPPDCSDPSDPLPGSITYAPFPLPPQQFSKTLEFIVPSPCSVLVFGLAGVLARRRQRGEPR